MLCGMSLIASSTKINRKLVSNIYIKKYIYIISGLVGKFLFIVLAIELSGAVCEIVSDLRHRVALLFFIIYI